MVHRSKNLLEAFRASSLDGQTPAGEESAPGEVGGPFAAHPTAAKQKPASATASTASLEAAMRTRIPTLGWIAAIVLAFIVGRMSAGILTDDVEAGEGASDAALSSASLGGASSEPEERFTPTRTPPAGRDAGRGDVESHTSAAPGGTEDDRSFLDRANRFTIRVIEYRADKRGRELAQACYDHLRSEGLPAIWPVEQGSSLILYVGASSDTDYLDSLRAYVAGLAGPPPSSRPGEFEDAYRLNIDDVILRE